MSDVVVRVEGVGKRYRIGGKQQGYKTFREAIVRTVRAPMDRFKAHHDSTNNTFWALKDVSFEVKRGEVLGIIGRNGAGKSTLLKILSRITEPTEGAIYLKGRVGSLLEVGTGFHPELTGRENIYLSGTILGMTRAEVGRKFDEIVDFAGVEQFIDTPVKRYSSGMGLRLGFAVAAHLEPEILVVDEVLAVGDAEFQKKCLGKMSEVAGQGRTVLFVSHNLVAIRRLCSSSLYLKNGGVCFIGKTEEGVTQYSNDVETTPSASLLLREDRRGTGAVKLVDIRTLSGDVRPIRPGAPLFVEIDYSSSGNLAEHVSVAIGFDDLSSTRQFTVWSKYTGDIFESLNKTGTFVCEIPELPLKSGEYFLHVYVDCAGELADYIENACLMKVDYTAFYSSGMEPSGSQGSLILRQTWRSR